MALRAFPSTAPPRATELEGAGQGFNALGPVSRGQSPYLIEPLGAGRDVRGIDQRLPNQQVDEPVGEAASEPGRSADATSPTVRSATGADPQRSTLPVRCWASKYRMIGAWFSHVPPTSESLRARDVFEWKRQAAIDASAVERRQPTTCRIGRCNRHLTVPSATRANFPNKYAFSLVSEPPRRPRCVAAMRCLRRANRGRRFVRSRCPTTQPRAPVSFRASGVSRRSGWRSGSAPTIL